MEWRGPQTIWSGREPPVEYSLSHLLTPTALETQRDQWQSCLVDPGQLTEL